MFRDVVLMLINWIFWLSSMERFIYKGLMAFLGGLVVNFDVV